MYGFFALLFTGLVIALSAAVGWTMRRLRRPPRRTYASAVARNLPGDPSELPKPRAFESWSGVCEVGRRSIECPVWDIEGDDGEAPVVVCTPGWGDSRVGALARVEALAPVASRIIAWDPPGLGEAPGLCALGVCEHHALTSIINQMSDEARSRGVVLYGWSLGAGVSIAAAAAPDNASLLGVIAEAPYRLPQTPARNVILNAALPWRANGPPAFALLGLILGVGPRWRGFDRAKLAQRMRQPLLVLHGTHDEVCPVDDGRAIAHAAPHGLFIAIEGAHHNDLWTDESFREQCAHAAQDFIKSLRIKSREAATT